MTVNQETLEVMQATLANDPDRASCREVRDDLCHGSSRARVELSGLNGTAGYNR